MGGTPFQPHIFSLLKHKAKSTAAEFLTSTGVDSRPNTFKNMGWERHLMLLELELDPISTTVFSILFLAYLYIHITASGVHSFIHSSFTHYTRFVSFILQPIP